MGFHNMDRLSQGASTLNTIMSTLHGDKELAKTIDSEGREKAVDMLEVSSFLFVNVVNLSKLCLHRTWRRDSSQWKFLILPS